MDALSLHRRINVCFGEVASLIVRLTGVAFTSAGLVVYPWEPLDNLFVR